MTMNFVATHDGHSWYRSSENRRYTHAVIRVELIEAARLAVMRRTEADWRDNFDYYKATSEGTVTADSAAWSKRTGIDSTPTVDEVNKAKATIEAGVEAKIAEALSYHDAFMREAYKSADGLSYYSCVGWCSRADLAYKLAANHFTHTAAIILEAREGAKKPKAATGRAGRIR